MVQEADSEKLPPLYAKWVEELLGGAIPREERASCNNCAMQPGPKPAYMASKQRFFDPVIKCCTYLPTLYNFLVGRILADTAPDAAQGRATVERRIADGVGVTPLGRMQTPAFGVLYKQSRMSFGKSQTLKCPHYISESGHCGVWRHRESTCATWFCKHVRGGVAYDFWRDDGLHGLLQAVEIDLAR